MLCAHCGVAGDSQCGKCKQVYYCGRECQVAAWPAHKRTCKAAAAAAAVASETLSAHLLSRQQKRRHEDELQQELKRRWEADEFAGVVEIADEVIGALEALVAEPLGVQSDTRFPLRGALTYATVGNAYTITGDYRAGLKMFERAVVFASELGPTSPGATHEHKRQIYSGYANALQECGRVTEALEIRADILFWAKQTPDADTACMMSALDELAGGHTAACNYAMAEITYSHCLGIALAHDEEEQAMATMRNLGHVKLQIKDHTAAYAFYGRSRDFALRLGNMDIAVDNAVCMAECKWVQACLAAPNSGPDGPGEPMAEIRHLIVDAMQLANKHTVVNEDMYRRILLLNAFTQVIDDKPADAVETIVVMLFSYAKVDKSHCWGCGQIHTKECPLRMCRDCRLARFCNKDCQRNASSSRLLVEGTCDMPHSRLCPMLRAHRKTVADSGVAAPGDAGALAGTSKAGLKLRDRIQEFVHETMQKTRAFAHKTDEHAT